MSVEFLSGSDVEDKRPQWVDITLTIGVVALLDIDDHLIVTLASRKLPPPALYAAGQKAT